jgi:hypothetical protein
MPAFLQTLPALTAALAGIRGRDKEAISADISIINLVFKV